MTPPPSTVDGQELRAVTFDATGTLFHAPRLGEIYSEVLTRHGVPVSAEQALALVRRVWVEFDCAVEPKHDRFAAHPRGAKGWWSDFLERLCRHLDCGEVSPFAASELYERFSRAGAWEVFPEAPAALEELSSAGLALGVVSNWDERLPQILERLGIGKWLAAVSYSQAVGVEKPHAAIFHDGLVKLGVEPGEALHVGDRKLQDVEGAEGAGMRAIHLDREGKGEGVSDLEELVKRLNPA
ncbi:MAG: HAD-IA family hydrolase [Acidobacteriota bacterium]|nr:HAD-IA family hydrolase [Acidobacteriota bacterium]